ncbi:MAG: MFS transporter [Oscillochloridaceae bacterium]|nr:MFS transporter [Chloroflexaceae bacterium]MDW8389351.1 MFS transporter [Oscillochloridaceae bacterium]
MGTTTSTRPVAHATAATRPATGAVPTLAPLSPAEVRRGMRISILEGAIANVHITITGAIGGSVFLTGYALLLGANSFQLGLMGALPFIGQVFQFVGAYLEERTGTRRALVLYGALAGRLIWALLLALPFLSFLQGAHLAIFFAGLACSYAFNGIAANAWMSWMSDLAPPQRRGAYFGVRNTVAALAAMAATFFAGWTLDVFRARGHEAPGYAVIFGVAVLSAVVAAALIARQPEPPLRPAARVNPAALFGAPLRDRGFRHFMLAGTGWALVTGIAIPFFSAYGLNTLKLSFATLSLTAIVTSAVSLVFGPLVGRLQDRCGYRVVLVACVLGTVPLPWGWVLSTPTNITPLWLTAIFSGVFWPGLNQGLANVLMERAPADCRGAALAAYSAATGLGTLVAGLLGGALATLLADAHFSLGPITLAGLACLFALTSLGRAVMAAVFWKTL